MSVCNNTVLFGEYRSDIRECVELAVKDWWLVRKVEVMTKSKGVAVM